MHNFLFQITLKAPLSQVLILFELWNHFFKYIKNEPIFYDIPHEKKKIYILFFVFGSIQMNVIYLWLKRFILRHTINVTFKKSDAKQPYTSRRIMRFLSMLGWKQKTMCLQICLFFFSECTILFRLFYSLVSRRLSLKNR